MPIENHGNETPPVGAAARLTPYELVFTEGDFESRIFPGILEEATAEKVDPLSRERFEFLSRVGDVVREMVTEDSPPEALEQYRAILYHAFNFWQGGRTLLVLESAAARYLVEAAPKLDEWDFRLPAESAYLQLPANLFWSSVSPESVPEPVDGFFVAAGTGTDPVGEPYRLLEVLVVLGIRRSRAGFSVIPLSTPVGAGIEAAWTGEQTREDGDFTNVLPGGEIAGLYSILTAGEVLKLVGRAFWYVDTAPESLLEVIRTEPRTEAEGPPPTNLAHVRITLGGRAEPGG